MAYCRNCGTKLIEGSKFCVECGERIISTQDAQVTQVQQSQPQQSQSQQPQSQLQPHPQQPSQYQQSNIQQQPLQYQQPSMQHQQQYTGQQLQQYQQPYTGQPPIKSKTPVIIGIVSAIVVIAIICAVVIATKSDNKGRDNKGRDDNDVAYNTEKPTEETTERPVEEATEETTEEITEEPSTTEVVSEPKNIDSRVPDVVNEIMAAPEYISSLASLGVYGDFNDDGVKELLLTYEVNSPDTGYCVIYSLMRNDADGIEIVLRDTLYNEVGGNSGYCGVTEYNGVKYFTLVQKIANGSGYSEYINMLPWDASGSGLTNEGDNYLECTVNIDEGRENGIYIYGEQNISMEEYDNIKNNMIWIHKLNPAVGPDPGYTASFDELLTIGTY